MAHSKSALKRWRQNERRRDRNKGVRSASRSAVKAAHARITESPDDAQTAIAEAASIIDRAAKGSVLHRNAAARHKSRMMRHANKVAGGPTTAEAPKRARKTTSKTVARKTVARKTATRKTAAKKTTRTKAAKG